MRGRWTVVVTTVAFTLTAVASAWAEAKVTVTREENKPSSVEVTEPGTYKYYVHISGVKEHAHTGCVVVK
jgi:cobalamin biosynthesis protein CbiD